MQSRLKVPRLLPLTIIAIAALLGAKSVALVRAAAPAATAALATPAAPAGQAAREPPSPAASLSAPAPAPSPAERQLLLDLRKRSAALDARAAALDAREDLLKAAEKRLAQRVSELQTLEHKLSDADASRGKAEDANWQALVKLYENMRPQDAATIFDGLAMPVLLEVVHRMNERKAALILAAMQPEKARILTTQLAAMPAPPPSPGS